MRNHRLFILLECLHLGLYQMHEPASFELFQLGKYTLLLTGDTETLSDHVQLNCLRNVAVLLHTFASS